MKKLIAIVLSLTLIATMGGVALAQSGVEPEEVNIVLPDGETANITKLVTIGDVGTVDVWGVIDPPDAGLTVTLIPAVHYGVAANTTVSFDEIITIDSGGPKYDTVTFYYGVYGVGGTEIGKQTISVTEGDLDIKPGSYPNSINTKNGKKGVIPIALLGSSTVNVTSANVSTFLFAGASPAHDLTDPATYAEHLQDVNRDGYDDLVSHYRTKDTNIVKGQTLACLEYRELSSAIVVTVCDSIRAHK
jgi:hypothetical protein